MQESSLTGALNVAVLSSAPSGGAGIAALRVKAALVSDPELSVDFIDIASLSCRVSEDSVPQQSMSNRQLTNTHFTAEYPGHVRGWFIEILSRYDVLNIHWASGLISLGEIDELSRRDIAVLFTCHDYYYFTGGCHYPAGCGRNSTGCLSCPQVDRSCVPLDLTARNLRWKQKIIARPNVHLCAPSRFLMNEAVKSGLIASEKTHVLRNPYEPEAGIRVLETAKVIKIVLIADSFAERRKGMSLAVESLLEAHRRMAATKSDSRPFRIDVIGRVDEDLKEALKTAELEYALHGRTEDHRELAGILASAQLLLTCSFEDNWPNVLVEAGAYGVIPIVGPGHGCEEFVRESGSGWVSREYNAQAFADAIMSGIRDYCCEMAERHRANVIDIHDPVRVRRQYVEVFRQILSRGVDERVVESGGQNDNPATPLAFIRDA